MLINATGGRLLAAMGCGVTSPECEQAEWRGYNNINLLIVDAFS